MTTKLVDGWECTVLQSGARMAEKDGHRVFFEANELRFYHPNFVPWGVVEWLTKPLLRSAYAQGWADRNGQLDGAEMPRIYEDT